MITQGVGAGPAARSLILSTASHRAVPRRTIHYNTFLKGTITPAIGYGNVPQFIEAQSLVSFNCFSLYIFSFFFCFFYFFLIILLIFTFMIVL